MRFNNKQIKTTLSQLRDDIRSGRVNIRNGNFKQPVLAAFQTVGVAASTAYFHPGTVQRLETLFNVPVVDHGDHQHYPTQDNYAWAVQNFINRRQDPWSFKRTKFTEVVDAQVAA